jgi:hypothetical protein
MGATFSADAETSATPSTRGRPVTVVQDFDEALASIGPQS